MVSERKERLHRKAAMMAIVVALQALAAGLFLIDFMADVASEGWTGHLIAEGAAATALVVAVIVGAVQVRDLIEQARQDNLAVALARRVVADLIRLRFAEWRLTAAEADVALFAIKGADVAEIARLRGAAEGTVRAQLTRIYAKAGVSSHSALVAQFLEDLIDPDLAVAGAAVSAGPA
ncbi:helix-turn-helix transcriptional regulator [Novosphingobium sp.]|uniref:helix-turn-helix transcriptional regulator n=1 Tax=Novosphingobium sp. TaxID=1874826 RepID=UPI00262D71E0|nr:helix-turn-helix transcriptional regulator [Novosphingobium sp.]